MLLRRKCGWEIPEREATDRALFLSRRSFLASIGGGISGALALSCGRDLSRLQKDARGHTVLDTIPPVRTPYPFARNQRYTIDRDITDETIVGTYNNFYEFARSKDGAWQRTGQFKVEPWTIEVTGLVANPGTFSVDELIRTMPMEERLYRLRCVEAWSIAVPWTGFPLAALLKKVAPLNNARFVRFMSFNDPNQAPGIREQPWYPWPYYEGLRLDEAMNELTMIVTGAYGHALPKQNGAPARLIVPWKYGYKSAKSIVRIELVDRQPHTFWNDEEPAEYSFESNVNPRVPHPRWSQANERILGTDEKRKTMLYNGYGQFVAGLYA